MTSNQPYLLRAYYQWIVDNDCTPHIAVDAQVNGVDVPIEHVKDGQIVLNIAPLACGDLQISDDWVSFSARFSGVARRLSFPTAAVLAIFARENGAGTMFMRQNDAQGASTDTAIQASPKPPVKAAPAELDRVSDTASEGDPGSVPPSSDPSEPTPLKKPKGKPTLTVVK